MVKWRNKSEIIVLVAVLFITVIRATAHNDDLSTLADDDEENSIRLPKSVIPIHYDLSLITTVHTGARAFTGNVKIRVQIIETTNSITLHNKDLTIESIVLTDQSGGNIEITYSADTSKNFLIISANDDVELMQGQQYNIEIQYRGNLRIDMGGFYRSQYLVDGETVPRYLAATQFQSTAARTAFPCFDEPALKATFQLKITHGREHDAISNTNGQRVNNGDGTTTTSFEQTPVMSSYLLAFVISDFAYRSLYNGPTKTEHRVYAREQDVVNVQDSLDNSYLFLKQLEDYCGYKYELNKMYSAAIPDFSAGAMENWGLILYKEQYLINSDKSHPRETFDMWRVTAHELAHQFFGNLVTYDWWDKIWLNEGFATFFEYLLVELTHPEVRFMDHYGVRKVQNAFRRDSLQSSAPMTNTNELQIPSIPSEVNYDKGGSVLRMFQYAIGDDLFRSALNRYLNDNHHQPVDTQDLLTAFESTLSEAGEIPGLDFSRAFKTWELQKGYPLIHVTFNSSSSQFHITQQHYLSVSEVRDENSDSSWYIPLSYTTAVNPDFENTKFTDYFVDGVDEKTISIATSIPEFDGSQWYIFNLQQIGFYRVNYDENNWREIIKILNSENYQQIHVLNRAQLVDDALTLAFDGVISYEIALEVVSYLRHETDFIPWYPATIAFDKLNYIMKGRPLHASFQRFVRILLRRMYVTLGLEHVPTDGVTEQFGRELAIDWTCRMGDERCLNHAYSQLSKDIPKPLDIAFVCNGLKGLNRQDEFVAWYRKFQTSSDQADRLRYIDGLLCSSDRKTLLDLLETTIASASEANYRSHERSRIYSNIVARSSAGLEALLTFIVEFYNDIRSTNGNVFDSWLISASTRVADYDDEVLLLQTLDKLEADGRTLNANTRTQIAKNIDFNKEWISGERYQDSLVFISKYLQAIDDEESQLRLPKTSEPRLYKIHLNVPNLQNGVLPLPYTGEVTIDIIIKETTDRIMFHSKRQTIDDLKVYDRLGNEIRVLDYSLQTSADSLTIYFIESLEANTQISVNIKYSTSLLTSSTGFYRTTYTESGSTKYLAATQFQPSSARYSFPCYDEPGYKTSFDLSITHDQSYHAIANTMGTTLDNGDGSVTTTFERTPSMSSYLLAYVVSEFASITNEETKLPRETLHRIWTKPDSISKAPYALENSIKALKSLEEYCYFDYALSKVDSAAIPNKNSAMENWGMVTYWETAMIYQEDYNDISHTLRFSGVRVIAHELAHQFFGDAVTCEWWSQIWLNEGFATIMQYTVVDQFEPTWRMHDFMTTFTMHNTAFIPDSRDTTRPMTSDVLTLTEISNSFDRIAYEKSGCVIRMFQHAIGEDLFRRSLQLYLSTNNYQPVVSQDLVDAIETTIENANSSRFDFDRALRTWENQKGYPVITVKYDPSLSAFRVTQERFFEYKQVDEDNRSWFIPINYATAANPSFTNTLPTHSFIDGEDELQIPINNFDSSQWYVFNKQQYGYYRVNYDEENWRALSYALNSDDYNRIHVMNRAQLIEDSFALAKGGYIDYSIAYDILKYLVREDDFFPWYTGYRYVNSLVTVYGNKNEVLNKFFNKLSEKFYAKFELPSNGIIPNDDLPERYGRDYALYFACNNGNELCLKDAYTLVKNYAHNGKMIPNGLERIYCSGLRGTGKEDEFVAIWDKMSKTSDATFKSTLINALGCTDDSDLLKAYLDSSIGSGNSVNYTADQRRSVFSAALNSNSGVPAVLDFIKRAQSEITSTYSRTLVQLLTTVASSIKTKPDQILFQDFLLTRDGLSGDDFLTLLRTVANNLAQQELPLNLNQFNLIKRILDEWENGVSDDGSTWLLPRTSRPVHYKIHLDVRNIQTGDRAYTGEATINIEILENTNRIVFHSKNQVFSEITAHNLDTDSNIGVSNYRLTPAYETIVVYFDRELNAGTHISVTLKYSTSLVTSSTGFYQTSYTMNGVRRYLGATQFEETGARYAFPCFDEPEYKAVFELTFTHDFSVTAHANTLGEASPNGDGTFTTTFEPSPIMSSYLNAFVISDLQMIDNSETKGENDTLHRIIVREDSREKAQYALENSIAALNTLEAYVGYKYEIKKLDSVGVPNKGGAMENWGLITYRENAMIYAENYDDIPHTQKYSGVRVISHEVAHQFFGNAVTCKWWSYIWLNEGFAQLLQYTLTDIFQPGWRFKDFMNVATVQATAFISDARTTTRAMTTEALTLTEIGNLFDNIAYDKSASVIRMFEYAVGEEIFKESLNLYISTFDHQPAVSQNLIDSFATVMQRHSFNDFDFERAFRSWELQKGYPVIHVSYMSTGNAFHVTQQRFFERKSLNVDDTTSWYIPLNYATSLNHNFTDTTITDYFVNGDDFKHITLSQSLGNGWFVFNKQQLGYYRVNYDESNWNALSEVLSSENYDQIHVMNRAQLLDDSFALVRAGYLDDYQTAYDILKYLANEDDYFPWYVANRYLSPVYTVFGTKNDNLNTFVRKLSEKFYAKYKLPSDNIIPNDILPERYGRALALDLACNAGNENCLNDAYTLVHLYADHDRSIPNGLENILCHGMRGNGKQTEFVNLWRKMQLTADTTYKTTLINALGCSDNPLLLKDYLESTLGSGASQVNYTQAERRSVFNAVLRSYSGLPVVIDFLTTFELDIISRYGWTLQTLLTTVANTIKTKSDQIMFTDYLLTLNNLSGDNLSTILKITANTLNTQATFTNARQMEIIRGIVNEWEFGIADGHQLRLPRTSVPEYYRVHFDVRKVHTGDRDYSGEATIDIRMLEMTNRIIFHSRNQVIDEVKAYDKTTSREITLTGYRLFPSADTIMIFFENALGAGQRISVNIKYSTSLLTSSTGYGFYQTSYTMDGTTRYVAATQFEPWRARFAFPCYDEPEYKAVFELSFIHDSSVVVHSNTMETIVDNGDGTTTTSFKPSPIMSSYLNAFQVSDFGYVDNSENKPDNEVYQRVIVRKDSLENAKYALINSIAALHALEQYAGFRYELEKLDSIMVPNKGGAMENWGLITYTPTALLYEINPEESSHTQLMSGVRVISHEVAHQFFGDAVTCKWWDVIWLNEGFAQYLQYALTDMFLPDWRMLDFMNILSVQGSAMIADARNTTRAMTTDALTPVEISALFDTIAYDKSGSVLRMFEYTLGEQVFRQAMNLYLNTNHHQGAVSQDLVDAIVATMIQRNVYTFDFDRAFRSWENQKGYPVIHVNYDESAESFHITQERFYSNEQQRANDGSSWYIPINYATAENPNFNDLTITDFFINGEDQWHIFAPQHNAENWYVFNKQQRGYYRVNYDASNWKALSTVLSSPNYNQVHVMNRAQLIDDVFALTNAGYLSDYQTAYDVLKYLVNENDFFPFYSANRYLSTLYSVFGNKNDVLNNFVKIITEKFYSKYALLSNYVIPSDTIPERYGRALALNLACNAGNDHCAQDTLNLVRKYAENDQKIPQGLETVLCLGLRGTGKSEEFVAIWKISQMTSDAAWKTTLLNALGCTDDEELLFDYLESSLGSGTGSVNYTTANRQTVFSASLQSKVAIPVFIRFMQKSYSSILSNYRYTWAQILTTVANTIKTRDDQIMFLDYITTIDALSGDDFKAISVIIAQTLSQQKLPQYANQIEIMNSIFSQEPRETTTSTGSTSTTTTTTGSSITTESTLTPTTTTTTESTSIPTTTTTTESTSAQTTTPNDSTSTPTESTSTPTTTGSPSTGSTTTTSTSTGSTTTTSTSTGSTTTTSTTTQSTTSGGGDNLDTTTPGSASMLTIKITTMILCMAVAIFLKST